jgi:glycosyltransferase involved in cell wall biosynthesis
VNRPVRITFVLTHPTQYQAPWLRYIASHAPELDLTVLYGVLPTAEQQGTGFGRPFAWDVPLTEGYRWQLCTDADARSVHSDAFFGLDVKNIASRIVATSPDVVLVTGWHSVMQVRALRACRRLGIPVLYRGDSTLFSGPRALVRPLWRVKTRAMLRQFHGYLSVGQHATAYLRSFGVPADRIFHSPHCVDNERIAAASAALRPQREMLRREIGAGPDELVVLFAGKFQDRKRPIDAVRAVSRAGRDVVLMMAGDGPLADAARAEAARLGVRLVWRGFLNQSGLPAAFVTSDCLIMPSTWETWGLLVNEALASGMPCVVTDGVAAAPDLVVEGETGYVTKTGDLEAMAAALRAINAARNRGHDYGPPCRCRVDACSFAAATAGLVTAARQTGLAATEHAAVRAGNHVA